MRKQIELTAPAAWINSRYYELQAAGPVMIAEEEPEDDFKVTLRESVKIGIGAFTVYLIIAMAIIIL